MKYLTAITLMLVVSACAVKSNPAKTTIYTPAGKIENHCPPGQAKKGNCVNPIR